MKIRRLAVSIYFFLSGICFATWASRIPDIQLHLHLNNAGLGKVLFALPIGLVVSLPLSGWLVTKFSSKYMMLVGGTFYPVVLVLLGNCDYTWQLAIGLFFFGVFGNLLNISMNTQAVSVEAEFSRSIMASFHGIWSLAGFLGAFTGTIMISHHVRPVFHFIIIALVAFLAAVLFNKYSSSKDIAHDEKQPLFVMPDKRLLGLGLVALCCMVCEGSMFDWGIIYFKNEVVNVGVNTTFGYVAFISSMTIGRFSGDWLVTRIGVRRMLQISGILIMAGLAVAVIFPYKITATFGFLLVGFGVSSVVPLVYSVTGRSGIMAPGVALAAVTTIGYFGFLFGPPVIGFIAQSSSLRWAFALLACMGLCAAILSGRVKMRGI